MTKDEELFDRYLKATSDGAEGLYVIQEDESYLHMLLAVSSGFCQGIARHPELKTKLPRPIVNFSDADDTQASAEYYNGRYFLSINIGIVKLLRFFFSYMLCDPTFLPMVGNVGLESPIERKLPDVNYYTYSDLLYDWGDSPKPLPKCQTRRLFLDQLLFLAVNFIFSHEMGHTLAGDAKFRKSASYMFGEGKLSDEEQDNLVNQCFEMNADYMAIHLCVSNLKADIARKNPVDRLNVFYRNEFEALMFLTIAINGTFLFMKEPNDLDISLALKYDYPPVTERALMVKEFIFRYYSLAPGERIAVISSVVPGIRWIEQGLQAMTEAPVYSVLEKANIALFQDHGYHLQRTWNRIRPELMKHSHWNLVEYQFELSTSD